MPVMMPVQMGRRFAIQPRKLFHLMPENFAKLPSESRVIEENGVFAAVYKGDDPVMRFSNSGGDLTGVRLNQI
jgi:hypothetical protein